MNMVQFLVENNADVNVCDNEGWTPLHATASCGFTEIARFVNVQMQYALYISINRKIVMA